MRSMVKGASAVMLASSLQAPSTALRIATLRRRVL
jgi:hypothetical protein